MIFLLYPTGISALACDCWFEMEDEIQMIRCWMEVGQGSGESWASSTDTGIDLSGQNRRIPGFKACVQVAAAE